MKYTRMDYFTEIHILNKYYAWEIVFIRKDRLKELQLKEEKYDIIVDTIKQKKIHYWTSSTTTFNM